MTPTRRGTLALALLLVMAVTVPALLAFRAGVQIGRDQRVDELEQRIERLEQDVANLRE